MSGAPLCACGDLAPRELCPTCQDAILGYNAYGLAADWKTFDGRPMPTIDDLFLTPVGRETIRRWGVAAKAIRAAHAS